MAPIPPIPITLPAGLLGTVNLLIERQPLREAG